jgi:hypothetical protein
MKTEQPIDAYTSACSGEPSTVSEVDLRAEFAAYCKRTRLRIAPVANGWDYAFKAWQQQRERDAGAAS